MEYSPQRPINIDRTDRHQSESNKMSTLTMPFPHHHAGFRRELQWQEPRPVEISRPRSDADKIALPSIRQAFPELQLQIQREDLARRPSTTSPTSGPSGALTPPEYVYSPVQNNKRRRPSFEDERDGERPSQIPRLYASPARVISQHQSPPSVPRQAPEPWTSGRSSPHMMPSALPSMRSPRAVEFRERMEPRLSLPSLPQMDYERNAAISRMRSVSRDEYAQEPVRQVMPQHMSGPPMEAQAPVYRAPSYEYAAYHHPTRVQSLSLGSIHPLDRTPFATGAYGHPFQETYMRIGELGMGMGGDNKQRKRRGNLPKETTDKLRAWFVAHLHHPYPTEDEKQELMRQTGLQMNQISNWFINARRRQLPTMVNNARAESEAMASRGGDSKVLPSTERAEYEHDSKRASVPLSDGEGSAYDEVDMDTLSRRRSANMKRGSV